MASFSFLLLPLLFFSTVLATFSLLAAAELVAPEPAAPGGSNGDREELVPAMFIFGDSLIDSGNNNDLTSLAKANYYPYGIDFEGGATGRFSNGYTIVDEIGNS